MLYLKGMKQRTDEPHPEPESLRNIVNLVREPLYPGGEGSNPILDLTQAITLNRVSFLGKDYATGIPFSDKNYAIAY